MIAVDHFNKVIDALYERGILITLFAHWQIYNIYSTTHFTYLWHWSSGKAKLERVQALQIVYLAQMLVWNQIIQCTQCILRVV